MEDIRDIHTQVEAVKIAMTQTKDGHILKLAIHPNDTPESIMRDPVGTRYMIVLVRMDDEGKPVASQGDEEGKKAIKLAGTLCSDSNFQDWLVFQGLAEEANEEAAATALREYLDVMSRKELRFNRGAREKLAKMKNDFVAYLNSGRR